MGKGVVSSFKGKRLTFDILSKSIVCFSEMSISRKTSNYCNNAKLSVGGKNGSVLPFSYTNADFSMRMGKRFSLACFDITMQNPTFEWATVLHFFVDMIKQSSLLGSKNGSVLSFSM